MNKITFKKFSDLEAAKYVIALFERNDISYSFSENKSSLDSSFSSSLLNEFEIKIDEQDFKKAEEILWNDSEAVIKNLPEDYYLFSFSEGELKEVVYKRDEWNDLDYSLAIYLLKKQGIELTTEQLNQYRADRIKELKKPEKNHFGWILAGYLFSFLGGLLGFIIGYVLYTQKKTLPNGERVYEYSEKDRKHGKWMIRIGVVVLVLNIFIKIIFF